MSANPQESAAYAEGVTARRNGKMFFTNPHPLGTGLSRAWSRGWKSWAGQLNPSQEQV